MAGSVPIAAEVPAGATRERVIPSVRADSVPWYVWTSVAAVTSIMVGGYWDISWHMSIGRDTFWTPAHMAIYFGGVLAGSSCAYLIISTTFGSAAAARPASVSVWGFRGPLGAFMAAWGGVAMLSSAPFDNWWHNAYGLDVKIFSPPHLVLDTGILAVHIGGLVMILGAMNRAEGRLRARLNRLFSYVGGMILLLALTVVWEYTYRVHLHNARCYRAVSTVAPVLLVALGRAAGRRWASTTVAGVYTLYATVMLWIFPLFPAEPKLGPVYQHITHFVPLEFPLLVIVPAMVFDLMRAKVETWNVWRASAALGAAFLVSFVAVQWPFGDFLLSPASRNWVFGTHYFSYFEPPTSLAVRNVFFAPEHTPAEFWRGMGLALVTAMVSTRLGLAWGNWMRRIRR